jgi:hypothetical protein
VTGFANTVVKTTDERTTFRHKNGLPFRTSREEPLQYGNGSSHRPRPEVLRLCVSDAHTLDRDSERAGGAGGMYSRSGVRVSDEQLSCYPPPKPHVPACSPRQSYLLTRSPRPPGMRISSLTRDEKPSRADHAGAPPATKHLVTDRLSVAPFHSIRSLPVSKGGRLLTDDSVHFEHGV